MAHKISALAQLAKVLVILKRTPYQEALDKDPERFRARLDAGEKDALLKQLVHQQHERCVQLVLSELERRSIQYDVIPRDQFEETITGYDLAISIGGDGTFLNLSRRVIDTPILGVNSAVPSSLGHFCLAVPETFGSIIDSIRAGKLRPHRLIRLALNRDGVTLPNMVLNEVLIHHPSPGGTTRYDIEVRGQKEFHRNSGLLIGTPSGSTGSLRSAGGKYIPATQRQLEYSVILQTFRPNENFKLLRGVLSERETVKVTSHTSDGKLFVDGYHIVYDFDEGSELVVSVHPQDLVAFIDPQVNKRYPYFGGGIYKPW